MTDSGIKAKTAEKLYFSGKEENSYLHPEKLIFVEWFSDKEENIMI